MGTKLITITTNNTLQTLGSPKYDRRTAVGNLSVENPTIEEMNEAIGIRAIPERSEAAPIFGTHVREGVAIVRDWVKNP